MSYVCSVCGETHDDLGAWALDKPDTWLALSDEQRAQGHCGSDLCETPDGHFFVRGVLEVPLIGGPQPTFEFGVWGSVSGENFRRYVETFDHDDQSKLGPMFSYLSNELGGFPGSFALKASLHPQNNRKRPMMELEPTDHPLAVAQREGIAFEKVLEIIHSNGAES
jgi:hypothetical protein